MPESAIPDEAVEAAALALDPYTMGSGGQVAEKFKAETRAEALRILEAAAPHMMGEAWKEGEAAGQDNAYAYQIGIAVKSNPYRPAVE